MLSVTVLAQRTYRICSGPFSSAALIASFAAGACLRWPVDIRQAYPGATPASRPDARWEQQAPAEAPTEAVEAAAELASPSTPCSCECICGLAGVAPEATPCTVGLALWLSVEVRLALAGLATAVVSFLAGSCCRKSVPRDRRPPALSRLEGYRQ